MSIFPGIYEYYERKLGFVRKCLSFSYICAMQIFMVDKSIIADNRAKLYYHRILLSAITGFFLRNGDRACHFCMLNPKIRGYNTCENIKVIVNCSIVEENRSTHLISCVSENLFCAHYFYIL